MQNSRFRITIKISLLFSCILTFVASSSMAQTPTIGTPEQSMGKMWTFDCPPSEYFKSTYQFSPDSSWFREVQLSALRFADYCSASFVSDNGLIMTNHHCARESGTAVQRKGEHFDETGFYASNRRNERKVEGLYVDQLIKFDDITQRVIDAQNRDTLNDKTKARDNELKKITEEYQAKPEWKYLWLQTVNFYSGGKYAIYGYKRYEDVRLVFLPELSLGAFGGEYDNFTYPRYDFDCSFFRVYDQNGKPIKSEHYFKFSTNGATENEAVFIPGNPGTTIRMSTYDELCYRREFVLPLVNRFLELKVDAMKSVNLTDSLSDELYNLQNALKDYQGELQALKNDRLLQFKFDFEKSVQLEALKKSNHDSAALAPWKSISTEVDLLKKIYGRNFLLSGTAFKCGAIFERAVNLASYVYFMQKGDTAEAMKLKIKAQVPPKLSNIELELKYAEAFVKACRSLLPDSINPIESRYHNSDEAILKAIARSYFAQTRISDSILNLPISEIIATKDSVLQLAFHMVENYQGINSKYKSSTSKVSENKELIGRKLFEIYGDKLAPDATFTLRINDGVVKGYDYNGTKAPYITTFYGLYDRYYSHQKHAPWNLPKRWENPPKDLLPIPLNFVTTNDITGGNSGSAMINKNREIVGLVFDGNIESLSGEFIYLDESNRAIGVHSSGIIGALKYIYKAKPLVKELRK